MDQHVECTLLEYARVQAALAYVLKKKDELNYDYDKLAAKIKKSLYAQKSTSVGSQLVVMGAGGPEAMVVGTTLYGIVMGVISNIFSRTSTGKKINLMLDNALSPVRDTTLKFTRAVFKVLLENTKNEQLTMENSQLIDAIKQKKGFDKLSEEQLGNFMRRFYNNNKEVQSKYGEIQTMQKRSPWLPFLDGTDIAAIQLQLYILVLSTILESCAKNVYIQQSAALTNKILNPTYVPDIPLGGFSGIAKTIFMIYKAGVFVTFDITLPVNDAIDMSRAVSSVINAINNPSEAIQKYLSEISFRRFLINNEGSSDSPSSDTTEINEEGIRNVAFLHWISNTDFNDIAKRYGKEICEFGGMGDQCKSVFETAGEVASNASSITSTVLKFVPVFRQLSIIGPEAAERGNIIQGTEARFRETATERFRQSNIYIAEKFVAQTIQLLIVVERLQRGYPLDEASRYALSFFRAILGAEDIVKEVILNCVAQGIELKNGVDPPNIFEHTPKAELLAAVKAVIGSLTDASLPLSKKDFLTVVGSSFKFKKSTLTIAPTFKDRVKDTQSSNEIDFIHTPDKDGKSNLLDLFFAKDNSVKLDFILEPTTLERLFRRNDEQQGTPQIGYVPSQEDELPPGTSTNSFGNWLENLRYQDKRQTEVSTTDVSSGKEIAANQREIPDELKKLVIKVVFKNQDSSVKELQRAIEVILQKYSYILSNTEIEILTDINKTLPIFTDEYSSEFAENKTEAERIGIKTTENLKHLSRDAWLQYVTYIFLPIIGSIILAISIFGFTWPIRLAYKALVVAYSNVVNGGSKALTLLRTKQKSLGFSQNIPVNVHYHTKIFKFVHKYMPDNL